jgi:polyisoprenoid-binding protein YceI
LTTDNFLCYDPAIASAATSLPCTSARAAAAGAWTVDPSASNVRFVAKTFGAVRVSGRFEAIAGGLVVDEHGAAGVLEIDAASIDTSNRLRDRHLLSRGFLDARRHPKLVFEARSFRDAGAGRVGIEGDLLIAGKRTPVVLDCSRRASADAVELSCRLDADRVDLGVRGGRPMVSRGLGIDVTIVLRRAGV